MLVAESYQRHFSCCFALLLLMLELLLLLYERISTTICTPIPFTLEIQFLLVHPTHHETEQAFNICTITISDTSHTFIHHFRRHYLSHCTSTTTTTIAYCCSPATHPLSVLLFVAGSRRCQQACGTQRPGWLSVRGQTHTHVRVA